jgi:purine-binding chemotaxis protein CheW
MTTHDRKYMIFSLQGVLYALDLKQVAEVGDPPQMWPIPLAPACYSGALNYHGEIVAAMNLALFLGLTGCRQPGKIIILHRDAASLAFLVDSKFPSAQLRLTGLPLPRSY